MVSVLLISVQNHPKQRCLQTTPRVHTWRQVVALCVRAAKDPSKRSLRPLCSLSKHRVVQPILQLNPLEDLAEAMQLSWSEKCGGKEKHTHTRVRGGKGGGRSDGGAHT